MPTRTHTRTHVYFRSIEKKTSARAHSWYRWCDDDDDDTHARATVSHRDEPVCRSCRVGCQENRKFSTFFFLFTFRCSYLFGACHSNAAHNMHTHTHTHTRTEREQASLKKNRMFLTTPPQPKVVAANERIYTRDVLVFLNLDDGHRFPRRSCCSV